MVSVSKFIDEYSKYPDWEGPQDEHMACTTCLASSWTQRDGYLVCGCCGTVEEA